jgi:hypothetical protein
MDKRGWLHELLVSASVRAGRTVRLTLADNPWCAVFVACSCSSCDFARSIGWSRWICLQLVFRWFARQDRTVRPGRTVRTIVTDGPPESCWSGVFLVIFGANFGRSELKCRTVRKAQKNDLWCPYGQFVRGKLGCRPSGGSVGKYRRSVLDPRTVRPVATDSLS